MSAHFGATLRMLRIDAGFSLGALAKKIGVSSAYLSRVEHGHDAAPTTDRLFDIARALGVPPHLLVDLAHKVDPYVGRYLERVPAAGLLFLEIARRDLGPAELARIKAFIDEQFPRSAALHDVWRSRRLSDHVTPESVVAGLHCGELEDAIDLAAAKLVCPGEPVDAPRVAQAIQTREREAASLLGGGLAVPHAADPRVPRRAAVVTLAEPLVLATPDGAPVRVVVVLYGGAPGQSELELLARVARLAHPTVVDALAQASSELEVLAELARLELAFG